MYACHQSNLRTIGLLVELAVSHTAVVVLDEAVKTYHYRVNAFIYFVERKLQNKVVHIRTEIDEFNREELLCPSKCKPRKRDLVAEAECTNQQLATDFTECAAN